MKALTVRQPWAWAIIYNGKDVENRTWSTDYRGTLLIHAARAVDRRAYDVPGIYPGNFPPASEAHLGAIIGSVELVDVVKDSDSEWAEPGCFHWILAAPEPSSIVYCRGQLGLWELAT